MEVMLVTASVVHSMLSDLSPDFVICHQYDEMGDPELASRIGNFIAPNEYVANLVSNSLVKSAERHTAYNESLPFYGADHVAKRLQNILDAVDSTYCQRD